MVAEAEETERLRAELDRAREDSERLLGGRARRGRAAARGAALQRGRRGEPDEASRRMVERVTRDLERERATSRSLRRELDELRSESAEQRRAVSSSTANGTLAMDEPPAPPPRPHAADPVGTPAPRRRRARRRRPARARGPAVAVAPVGGADRRRARRVARRRLVALV